MSSQGAHAPARLGRYELLARIATGGMGEIFLARLEGAAGFQKLYVVKRILPHLADDARFRGMLVSEARVASRMAHANICQVYELGETDGQLYIVMEYLEGVPLLQLLRRTAKEGAQLELGMVGGVIQQVADALHYAHELTDHTGESLGIIHRDVTPGNIFVTESGMAKVLDFGIAKVKDASANTQTGTVKGKYAYMAPEQLRGAAIDRRVDVFALGVVAYEMLALRRLFQRPTDYLTFQAVMEQPVADVRRYRPDVPDPLAAVIARAIDRDPDARFATARQLGAALLDALGARPWSQHDVSDYVRTTFSHELGKRRAQTASAVQRTSSALGRSTMPLLALPHEQSSGALDEDDDDGFPSVEADDAHAPIQAQVAHPTHALPRELQGQTPPPFGIETSPSGAGLQPLAPAPAPALAVVVHKRGLLWPLVALAMVGITGGALYLVWRQADRQPAQEIIITSESTRADTNAAGVDPQSEEPGTSGSAGGGHGERSGSGRGSAAQNRTRKAPPANPYTAAVAVHKGAIHKCVQDHGLRTSAKLRIVVTTAGRTKSVSFEPEELNGSPVGACIRNVLSAATFPKASDEKQLVVPVQLKSS